MEGLIDPPLRQLLTEIGRFDYCVTEFLRVVDQLLPERVFYRICPELYQGGCTASGVPVHLQLLGSDPTAMAENAARGAELGAPVIDINFGCPAKTVNKNLGGAALLAYPDHIHKTVAAVRQAVPKAIPVTAKMRLGLTSREYALEVAQAIAEANASWITIHARTKSQGYRPPVYWEDIAPIQAHLSCPVVANGDIVDYSSAKRCQKLSQSPHLMIGRGAVRNPLLSLQIQEPSTAGEWSWHLACQALLHYYQLVKPHINHPAYLLGRIKQWLSFFREGLPEARVFFDLHKRIKCLDTFMKLLNQEAISS